MKQLFTIAFLFCTTFALSQTFSDSLSVLKNCNFELSQYKYTDFHRNKFQMFLDIDADEIFIIVRQPDNSFKKITIESK